MKLEDDSLNNLLEKYCTGEISRSELMLLGNWMQESDENRDFASRTLKLYRSSRAFEVYDIISPQEDYQKTIQYIRNIKKRRRRNIFFRYAASLIVLFGLFTVYTWFNNTKPTEFVSVIGPGEAKATLILEDGSQVALEELGDSILVRRSGVIIQKEGSALNYQSSVTRREVLNTVRIPRGGEYSLILSDGTKIWLNSDSELQYPVNFVSKQRMVSISGEAFLEVAEDAKKPFIINANGMNIQVLGTSFNVRAYADEDIIQTTLVSGKVELYKGNDRTGQVILSPGEQGTVTSNSNDVMITKVNTKLYTSWKDGEFRFENKSLAEIMKTLERWYDVKVHFEDNKLENLHFTGDLERYDNINTHLEMISLTTSIEITIDKNDIYIKNN